MKDQLLIAAGIGGMMIAIIHGYIGHKRVLQPITGLSPTLRRVNGAVFQLSTLYWFSGGILLAIAPFYLEGSNRPVIAVLVAVMYLSAAMANFWATRGQHFGWILLIVTAVLALLGA